MKNEGATQHARDALAKCHGPSPLSRPPTCDPVHGAYGYSADTGSSAISAPRAPIIYEGTTQIHKLMQAEHALGSGS